MLLHIPRIITCVFCIVSRISIDFGLVIIIYWSFPILLLTNTHYLLLIESLLLWILHQVLIKVSILPLMELTIHILSHLILLTLLSLYFQPIRGKWIINITPLHHQHSIIRVVLNLTYIIQLQLHRIIAINILINIVVMYISCTWTALHILLLVMLINIGQRRHYQWRWWVRYLVVQRWYHLLVLGRIWIYWTPCQCFISIPYHPKCLLFLNTRAQCYRLSIMLHLSKI